MREIDEIFSALGLRTTLSGASYGDRWFAGSGDWIEVHSPATGELLAKVEQASEADRAAASKVDALARGVNDDLHGTMIAVKEADISI